MVERLDRFVRLLIGAWMLAVAFVLCPAAPALALETFSQEQIAASDSRIIAMPLDEVTSIGDHDHSDQSADHTHDVPWLVATSSMDRPAEKSAKWLLLQAKPPHGETCTFERPPRL